MRKVKFKIIYKLCKMAKVNLDNYNYFSHYLFFKN